MPFMEQCVICGAMCHLWSNSNVLFMEQYVIYGGICHLWSNVPFMDECPVPFMDECIIYG